MYAEAEWFCIFVVFHFLKDRFEVGTSHFQDQSLKIQIIKVKHAKPIWENL